MNLLETVFGAKAQIVVGTVFTLAAIGLWLYFTLISTPTVSTVFHISMLFGVAATYAIVATGLGYRKTEHVEAAVADIDITSEETLVESNTESPDQKRANEGNGA